jgi:DNA-binding NarL/FixJ family response regulator
MNIVLHSDDIFLLDHWYSSLNKECTIVDDFDTLYSIDNSLIILNYSVCNSECELILSRLNEKNKVLVLDSNPNINVAKEVLSAGAKGYGNALMRTHFIVSAVETIRENMVWLYPEFTTMLIEEIPQKNSNPNLYKLDLLSDREKEVALLLKDGFIYKEVAQKLNITPRTVKAHASHIYSKLAVKDRLGLALLLK